MAKMGRPKKEITADKRITIRFNDEEYALLLEEADKKGMTISQLARLSFYQTVLKKLDKEAGEDKKKDEK